VDGVHTVDASGDVDGAGFVGLSDLSELLLDDARFRSCYVQTWRRWGTNRDIRDFRCMRRMGMKSWG